jgi:tRNA ligase
MEVEEEIILLIRTDLMLVGEVTWTQENYLATNTVGPYEVTVKENGCIIFVSAVDNTLLVTSKHAMTAEVVNRIMPATSSDNASAETTVQDQDISNAPAMDYFFSKHASKGEEWVNRHLQSVNETRENLINFLQTRNITAVFELADDDFEEHILEYPPDMRGLYLHGINVNSVNFQTWPQEELDGFAKRFGFKKVEYKVFDTYGEVKKFTDECRVTGHFNGRAVEGFVVRCKSSEGDRAEFFKVKYDEPYLMFRE